MVNTLMFRCHSEQNVQSLWLRERGLGLSSRMLEPTRAYARRMSASQATDRTHPAPQATRLGSGMKENWNMRYLKGVLGLIGAVLMMAPQAASAQQAVLEQVQYGGGVTCRVSPTNADRFRGGDRDCRTNDVRGGTCYCPSARGMIPGDVVRGGGGGYGGGGYGGGGYGGGGYGGYYEPQRRGPRLVCRISASAAVYTGGDRDCSYTGRGPGGSCYCPSARGPIRGDVVQVR